MANTNMFRHVSFPFLSLMLLLLIDDLTKVSAHRKIHYIHWNKANPMFRLDNTDHIIDVNAGNLPGEYDQVNIICPVSKADVRMPERHVIYSVSREEFDSCRITNPKPRIVAVCSKPYQLLYFTITFRSFSPTPGGLEFHPGQDYYFISTSSSEDLHRRVGGGCSKHNMRMIFKVSNDPVTQFGSSWMESSSSTTSTTTTKRPLVQFKSEVPRHREYYVYHPRDLIESRYRHKKGRFNQHQKKNRDNDVWKNEALRYTSSATGSSTAVSLNSLAMIISAILMCVFGQRRLRWCPFQRGRHLDIVKTFKKFFLRKKSSLIYILPQVQSDLVSYHFFELRCLWYCIITCLKALASIYKILTM